MRTIFEIVLVAALFAVVPSAEGSQLSPEDCQLAGVTMGMMIEAANTGLAPDKVLHAVVEDMSQAPDDVQEMVKFMALVAVKDVGKYTADEIADAMAKFCLRWSGDVGAMVKFFKVYLGIKEQSL